MSNIKNREELLNDPSVLQQIQERAYFIAESSGFAPERDHENWLSAQEEVLTKLTTNGKAVEGTKVAKAPAQESCRPQSGGGTRSTRGNCQAKSNDGQSRNRQSTKSNCQTRSPRCTCQSCTR